MKKIVSTSLLSLLIGVAAYATECKEVTIESVGKKVCAEMTSFDLKISMKPGSQMDKMHQGFGKKIDALYETNRKKNEIPHAVDADIRKVTYNGKNYHCQSASIVGHDYLLMKNCTLETYIH